ncbi:TauD/TfdA family dioxygenase [Myxococcota bacterium]|nr:TauD/TfdA family dioxygenase [Myxococcota bacterium]
MGDGNQVRVRGFRDCFAGEIRGLDLSRTLSPAILKTVREAWAEFPVLCFPDQPLDVDALESFTAQIGPFGNDPFIEPMQGHPNVLEVRRGPDEKGIVFGAAWHSDWSFQECPPSATLLQAKIVPPIGGDTLFADCRRAWKSLPDDLKRIALRCHAIHSAKFAYGTSGTLAKDQNPREMKILTSEKAHQTRLHPMVRTHPVTGLNALFVNPVYTTGVDGMSKENGRAFLDQIYEHIVQDEYLYRHNWREDMLLMWDNRCVIHNAEGGYEGHARLMYRTTVAGEKPVDPTVDEEPIQFQSGRNHGA